MNIFLGRDSPNTERQLRFCIHISFFMAWEEYGIWPLDDGFPFDFSLDKAGCHHYGSEAMIDVRIIKSLSGSILSGVNYLHLIVCPRPSLWVSPRTKNRVGLAQRRVRQRKWNWNLASSGQTGPTAGGRENLNWRQNTEYIGSRSLCRPGLAILSNECFREMGGRVVNPSAWPNTISDYK